LNFLDRFFEKYPHITFNRNPFSGSRVVPCGQSERWRGVTKLIGAFRNFAKELSD